MATVREEAEREEDKRHSDQENGWKVPSYLRERVREEQFKARRANKATPENVRFPKLRRRLSNFLQRSGLYFFLKRKF